MRSPSRPHSAAWALPLAVFACAAPPPPAAAPPAPPQAKIGPPPSLPADAPVNGRIVGDPPDTAHVYVRVSTDHGARLAAVARDGSVKWGPDADLVALDNPAIYRFGGADLFMRRGLTSREDRVFEGVAPLQIVVEPKGSVIVADLRGRMHRIEPAAHDVGWTWPLPLFGTIGADPASPQAFLAGTTPDGEPCFREVWVEPQSAFDPLPPKQVQVGAWGRVCRQGGAWARYRPVVTEAYPCTGCEPQAVVGPWDGVVAWRSESGSRGAYVGGGKMRAVRVGDGMLRAMIEVDTPGIPNVGPVAMSADGVFVLACAVNDELADAPRPPGRSACGVVLTSELLNGASALDASAPPRWIAVPALEPAWPRGIAAVPMAAARVANPGWPGPGVWGPWSPP